MSLRVIRQLFALLEDETDPLRGPKLRKKFLAVMLDQLQRGLAQDQIFLREGDEKRRAGFRLLRARLCDFFGVDVDERDRRLRSNRVPDRAWSRGRCVHASASRSTGSLSQKARSVPVNFSLRDRLQRPMQREEAGVAGEKRSAIGRRRDILFHAGFIIRRHARFQPA